MDEGTWYIRFGSRTEGPVSTATLRTMVTTGKLKPDQDVRPRLDGQWTTAERALRETAFVSPPLKSKVQIETPRMAPSQDRRADSINRAGQPVRNSSAWLRGVVIATTALGAIALVTLAAWSLTRPRLDSSSVAIAEIAVPAESESLSGLATKASPTLPRSASAAPSLSDPEALFAMAAPAVFKIVVHGNAPQLIASGSGFFIGAEYAPKTYQFHPRTVARARQANVQGVSPRIAYALTNHHVIDQAIYGDIELHDKSRGVLADVLYEDYGRDVALVTVILDEDEVPPTLQLADAASINIGTKVFAIGNPQGFSNTLSDGLISGIRTIRGNNFLQTSAPISQGSSGGPLLIQDGTVIGITTATITDGQNLNLAVRFDEVRHVLKGAAICRPLWQGVSIDEQLDLTFRRALETVAASSNLHALAAPLGMLRDHITDSKPVDSETFFAFHAEVNNAPINADESIRLLVRFIDGKRRQLELEARSRAAASSDRVLTTTEYTAAVEEFERALEIDPEYSPAYEGLARCHFLAGDFAKSKKAADRLTALVPQSPRGHHLRAACLLESNDYEKAAESLVAAIGADTSYDGTAGLEEVYWRSLKWGKLAEWCREYTNSDISSQASALLALTVALEREQDMLGACEAAELAARQYALTGSPKQTEVAEQRLAHLLSNVRNKER